MVSIAAEVPSPEGGGRVSLLANSKPMRLSAIALGSLVLVDVTWHRLERVERRDDQAGGCAGWLVFWVGSVSPSSYPAEPTLTVWTGADALPPRTSGVVS